MRNRILRLAALAIALFCVTSTAHAQGNSIRGKVRNPTGQNVSQMMIELQNGTGQTVDTTVTNSEGDFSFAGLTGTSYIVVIRNLDFETVNEHVEFVRTSGPEDPGERRTVQITLVSKGSAGGTAPVNRTVPAQNLPKGARDSLERAMKLAKESKSNEAIAAYQEAIKIYPTYFEAHLLLAGEYLKAERLGDAINEFEEARKINPKDDRVYRGFGQVLMMQKKYALASQVLAEASRLNPTDASILLMRGTALIEHAIAINPSASKEAAAERNASFGMAEKALLEAFEVSGRKLASTHLQLARLYEKKGDRGKAADEIESYLKMAPDDKKADALRAAVKTLRSPASDKKP